MDPFSVRKAGVLAELASAEKDKSKKGGLDRPIAELVAHINSHYAYFTTSSCSGRISLFSETTNSERQKLRKKGGDWFFVSHEITDPEDVVKAVDTLYGPHCGQLVFRFEPFILAVECRSVEDAHRLVSCAIGSGFRESGITSMGKRIIAAVRCSIRMEVPVADAGKLLVPHDYLRYLVRQGNEKFSANQQRTDRFLANFILQARMWADAIQHSSATFPGDQDQGQRDKEKKQIKGRKMIQSSLCSPHLNGEANGALPGGNTTCVQGVASHALAGVPLARSSLLDEFGQAYLRGQQGLTGGSPGGDGSAATKKIEGRDLLQLRKRQVAVLQRISTAEARMGLSWDPHKKMGEWVGLEVGTNKTMTPGKGKNSGGLPVSRSDTDKIVDKDGEVGKVGPGTGLSAATDFDSGSENFAGENCLSVGWDRGPGTLIGQEAASSAGRSQKLENGEESCFTGVGGAMGRGRGSGGIGEQKTSRPGLSDKLYSLNPENGPTRSLHFSALSLPGQTLTGDNEKAGEVKVQGQLLKFSGLPGGNILRWSHQSVVCQLPGQVKSQPSILVFAGYGGPGLHMRLNDLLEVDPLNLSVKQIKTNGIAPCPRLGHTCTLVGTTMVVIGGREGPVRALGDVHVLDLRSMTWSQPTSDGPSFQPRFRHAAAAVGSKIFVFGGLAGLHEPIATLQVFDTESLTWSPPMETSGNLPSARHSHTMCTIDDKIFIHGGRAEKLLEGALYKFDPKTLIWTTQTPHGSPLPSKFSHSLEPFDNGQMIIFGGCPVTNKPGRLFLVDSETGVTREFDAGLPPGCLPVRHTASVVGNRLFVIGGGAFCFAFGSVFSPPFSIDLRSLGCVPSSGTTAVDRQQATAGNSRDEAFCKVATAGACAERVADEGVTAGARSAQMAKGGVTAGAGSGQPAEEGVTAGACSEQTTDEGVTADTCSGLTAIKGVTAGVEQDEASFDKEGQSGWAMVVDKRRGKRCKDELKARGWLDLSREVQTVDLTDLGSQIAFPLTEIGAQHLQDIIAIWGESREGRSRSTEPGGLLNVSSPQENAPEAGNVPLGGRLQENATEAGKAPVGGQHQVNATEAGITSVGWTFQVNASESGNAPKGRATQVNATEAAGVPLVGGETFKALPSVTLRDVSRAGVSHGGLADINFPTPAGEDFPRACLESLQNGALLQRLTLGPMKQRHLSPHQALKAEVSSLLKENCQSEDSTSELPTRWERLGDMVILPSGSLESATWQALGPPLWSTVARALGAQRVARQARIAPTSTRDSQLEVLLGDSSWVEHRENGILYCFDAARCMFSSGNVSEKLRVSKFMCREEIVVDLFAGLGYYTLPYLLKAGAAKVYACEWNPNAIRALRHNLKVNGVEGRCILLEGDNRLTAPQGVAHRVNLGLIPSSEASWPAAVKALTQEGGMLHVHGNALDSEEHQWASHVVNSITQIAAREGLRWKVEITHFERVKWYAPHIRHLVADLRCRVDSGS